MQIQLGKRMAAAAALVLEGKPVADIGTDHAYLPVYLIVNDLCPNVVASDVARGPLASATQLVELLSLTKKIDVRLGEGLEILQPGEVSTICITGMGGLTIREILQNSPDVLAQTERLVLQPQRNAAAVRTFLAERGWKIIKEDLVYDSGFYYVVIASEHGEMELDEIEAEYGPLLLAEPHSLLKQYLELKLSDMQAIIDHLANKTGKEVEARRQGLIAETQTIQRILYGDYKPKGRE